MGRLIQLPPEILGNILTFVDPQELARVRSVCRYLNGFVKGNSTLHKEIYYRLLDEPPSENGPLDWERELQDYERLRLICASQDPTKKTPELLFVANTALRLLANASRAPWPPVTTKDKENYAAHPRQATFPPSRNAAFLCDLFSHERDPDGFNREVFLTRSAIFDRLRVRVYARLKRHGGTLPLLLPINIDEDGTSIGDSDDDPHDQFIEDFARTEEWNSATASNDDADSLVVDPNDIDSYPIQKAIRQAEQRRRQQSAKLHALFGNPILNLSTTTTSSASTSRVLRSSRVYPFACAKVYDLREYTTGSEWGPFLADGSGRVDWEKVEAIQVVLRTNLRSKKLERSPAFSQLWSDRPFAGSWPGSWQISRRLSRMTCPHAMQEEEEENGPAALESGSPEREEEEKDGNEREAKDKGKSKKLEDPYGVTGIWMRVVCFLDYNDFYQHNFPVGDTTPDDAPRRPLDIGEATRLVMMKIKAASVEQDDQTHPVVHFRGTSRAIDHSWDDNANSDIRGTVRMTPEGEVRWTTFSIFDGQERWRSEGVQVGGVGSARGVVGNWFDK